MSKKAARLQTSWTEGRHGSGRRRARTLRDGRRALLSTTILMACAALAYCALRLG